MKRFVEGEDRSQSALFSERLDDYVSEDNPVRVDAHRLHIEPVSSQKVPTPQIKPTNSR